MIFSLKCKLLITEIYISIWKRVTISWSSGDIVVQVLLVHGKEQAFTAHAALPLRTWIRLDIFFQVLEVFIMHIHIHFC